MILVLLLIVTVVLVIYVLATTEELPTKEELIRDLPYELEDCIELKEYEWISTHTAWPSAVLKVYYYLECDGKRYEFKAE
ncbi:MAG: hypothetical protein ABFQ62_03955 [Patescibacteria group bacterium]